MMRVVGRARGLMLVGLVALLTGGAGAGCSRGADRAPQGSASPTPTPTPGPGEVDPDGGMDGAGGEVDLGGGGDGGQPRDEEVCRKAVQTYARLKGLTLDPMQLRQFTLLCLDGSAELATCIAKARGLRELEKCENAGGPAAGGFAEAAEAVGSRPRASECDEAIANLVKLVPEMARDRADFQRACMLGTRTQASCVARARRAEDLSRCP
ncbi:MAG: hypothetical protein IT370_12430 [Deltaproteobacteria bacterium]|nr:hypothetical protein [Deltaproteobacteria bacterium]